MSPDADRFMKALLEFIERELQAGRPLTVDTYLFDAGRIDSLKILQLIAFVEHWTGAQIPEREIVMANFRSVRTIAEHFSGTCR